MQCIRAQHQCPGYRDACELNFRNQTDDVIRKATRQSPSKPIQAFVWRTKQQPTSRVVLASGSEKSRRQAPRAVSLNKIQLQQALALIIPCSIMQPVEAQATGFFLSSYVLGSHFDYLPSLYRLTGMNELLSAGIHAVGLAILSNEFNSSDLLKKSRKWYSQTLHLTNLALSSPCGVTDDSNLVAVMLLSLYEFITCRSQLPMTAWTDHINGATELIRLRGRQQLRTPLGLELFTQMTDNIFVSCVQREVSVPSNIIALRAHAANLVDGSCPAWRFSDIVVRYTSFRAAIKNGNLSDPDSIIACAMKIDSDLSVWSKTLPLQWKYDTVFTDTDPELVYEGYFHVYHDHRIAQILNSFHMNRILLHQLINDRVVQRMSASRPSLISPDYTALAQLSLETMLKMTSDICASVPQFTASAPSFLSPTSKLQASHSSSSIPLSVTSRRKSETLQPGARHPYLAQHSDPFRVAGGYFLLWPLFMVGSLAVSPNSLRLWVINRLYFIGSSMKIPQALLVARILEGKESVDSW